MRHQWNCRDMIRVKDNVRRRLTTFQPKLRFGKGTMDKDRVAGSAKKIKGSIKEVVGKAGGEAEGKADKVEDKVQKAVGGFKDMLKSTASTRLRATSQRKTLLASAAMIGVDLFCGPAGAQGGSQSASPSSQTRLATAGRSGRRSAGAMSARR